MNKGQSDVRTDLGLVALAAIWGINFTVVKIVLDEIEPMALNALRFPLATAALAWVVHRRSGPLVPRREDVPRILLLAVVGNVLYQIAFIFGIDWTLAGNASLLLSTTPVWTMILSFLAGHERPGAGVLVGIVGTLLGMVLVVTGGGSEISLDSATWRGDLLMVLASVLWSAYTVLGRRPVHRYGALRVTTWGLWAGTPILVALGTPALMELDFGSVSVGAWAGVAYAGLLSIAIAYVLWYQGVRRLGNSRTAVYSNVVPVWALIAAWFWLGERPSALQLAGAVVILIGLTATRKSYSPAPAPTSPEPSSPTVPEYEPN